MGLFHAVKNRLQALILHHTMSNWMVYFLLDSFMLYQVVFKLKILIVLSSRIVLFLFFNVARFCARKQIFQDLGIFRLGYSDLLKSPTISACFYYNYLA